MKHESAVAEERHQQEEKERHEQELKTCTDTDVEPREAAITQLRSFRGGELVQELAHMVKSIADAATGSDIGRVKTMIDLGLRKTATVD